MSSVQGRAFTFFIRYFFAPLLARMDIARLQTFTDATSGQLKPPRGVQAAAVNAGGVPAAWLVPPAITAERTLLYLHGGGFVSGSIQSHKAHAGRLARTLQAKTLIINYRLAPRHPFPAALEDCLVAYDWLLEKGADPRSLLVAGDSAGGNLTLALLLALRQAGKPMPGAALCFSPVTDVAFFGQPEVMEKWDDAMFRPGVGRSWIESYLGTQSPENPLISPYHGDLAGLPPILIQAGEAEMLVHDARRFAEKAHASGADLVLQTWPGMFHVFQLSAPFLPEANQAIQDATDFVNSRLPALLPL